MCFVLLHDGLLSVRITWMLLLTGDQELRNLYNHCVKVLRYVFVFAVTCRSLLELVRMYLMLLQN